MLQHTPKPNHHTTRPSPATPPPPHTHTLPLPHPAQAALADPDSYVLKPQREGGGNNLYGEELAARLRQGGEGLRAYILMQRIKPPPQKTLFVRQGGQSEGESLSELGIYGTYLKCGPQVVLNKEAGHLVRTKTSSSNEGGVAAGYAVLDSPYLVEAQEIGSFQVLDLMQ